MAKDTAKRCEELERHNEALETAMAEIHEALQENLTLANLRRRIARILLSARQSKSKV